MDYLLVNLCKAIFLKGIYVPKCHSSLKKNEELIKDVTEIADRNNATPAQISLAWMVNKKPYIVPILGSRHINRIKDNLAAGEIKMTPEEVAKIDEMLDNIPMSDVFGGSKIKKD